MTDKIEHIIKAQQYHIVLDKEEEAHQVQSQISVLQESRINSLLETILNRFSNEDNIYQFDSIELDLGVIRKANYENELVYRLEEELTKYFNANITDNGTLRSGKVIVLNDRKLEQFEHFILNGHLNWESSAAKAPSTLLKELMVENRIGLVNLLNEHGKKEPVRKRLIYQFNEEPLESIVTAVAKTESIYIISYKRNMLKHQQQQQHFIDTAYTTFRNAVWEVILAYLFVESNSYYNKKSFLQYLIRKIAEKYNLTYELLLNAIVEGVDSEQKASNELEFKKIIIELKTEHQQQATKSAKSTTKKIAVKEWIDQVEHYLKFGSFHSNFQYTSRTAFNHQFELILLTKDSILVHHITNWLNNSSISERLLAILNDRVLNQLIKNVSIPFITESIDFFEHIQKNRSILSSSSSALWNEIEVKKARLIIGSFVSEQYLVKEVLPDLLKNLKHELDAKQAVFFQLLTEVQEKLPAKYHQVIEKFLVTFSTIHPEKKQPIADEKIVENITQTIRDFTNNNEVELWHYWINQELPKWMVITGLKKHALLILLKGQLIKQVAQPQIITFIEHLEIRAFQQNTASADSYSPQGELTEKDFFLNKKLEAKNTVISPLILELLEKNISAIVSQKKLFSEWSKEVVELFQQISKKYNIPFTTIFELVVQQLKQATEKKRLYQQLIHLQSSTVFTTLTQKVATKEKEQHQHSKVYYVLEKGLLPWWAAAYSWDEFNLDFTQLWNSSTGKKELIQLLHKTAGKISLPTILNKINLEEVWKELDRSSHKIYTALMVKIHELFKQQMLPAGIITLQEYHQFNEQAFKILAQQQASAKTGELLFNFIKQWISSVNEAEQTTIKNLFIRIMQQIGRTATQVDLKNEIQKWEKELANISENKKTSTPLPSANSVQEFLTNHTLAEQWEGLSLLGQLEKMRQTAAVEWKNILHQTTLRESLVEELDEQAFLKLIHLNLNTNQQQFLVESMAVIECSIPFISSRELSILKKQYFQLILLKLSTGGFNAWTIENWSTLLLQCMENVLGESKSNEVLLKVNGKLLAEKGDQYKSGIILLDQMHRTIMKKDELEAALIKKKEEKDYRKLGEETPREFLDPIFIKNAGLIILSPYLGMLFEKCGLMLQGEFIDEESKFKAVHLLEYAATGKTGKEEHELVINKLLCGMNVTDPVERNIELSDTDKEIVNGLLTAVTQQWKPLNGTSIEGLQLSFLQRDGKLEEENEQYFLRIEQKAFDMLLDQISWNITRIKLRWMQKMLIIEWR